ncbi:MAG TPA: FliM/FliN family flagellar motor switch protein [Acidimicrobiales bacterium]
MTSPEFEAPLVAHDVRDDDERLRVREAQFRNVSVEVSAWVGKTRLSFGELSELRPGHVVELDQVVGAPIDIVLNREVLLARGEVVEVGDEYGVRITEIVSDKAV